MTKFSILALLTIALALPTVALAQSTTSQPPEQTSPTMTPPPDQNSQTAQPQATQPPDQNSQPAQPQATPQMQSDQSAGTAVNGTSPEAAQTMSGTISSDGKTFTSNNTTYNVSNPNSVKAYANQPISVEYEMDTNNSIRVTKVILAHPQQ